jgi:hypothetical protein
MADSSNISPNEQDPPKIQLHKAKAWLIENPQEKQSTAAQIFKINKRTLSNSIIRVTNPSHGGQNQILLDAQEHALHASIQDWLSYSQKPTCAILLGAICKLQNPLPSPSANWFTNWWKSKGLHKIKTKPISRLWVTAQDEKEVEEWWNKVYLCAISQYQIKARNIHNFDKTGFQVGCSRGVEVIVLLDVKELYSISPEDCRSLTIIEDICATSYSNIPPFIIVQGQYYLESWYWDGLKQEERVITLHSGFTNKEIALQWLDHFI